MAIEYDPKTDYYAILSIASDAASEDIKKAHRARICEIHPDHGGDPAQAAAVNIARDVLSDPDTRRGYDQARREWMAEALSSPLLRAFLDPEHSPAGDHTSTAPASAPDAQEAPTAGTSRLHARFAGHRPSGPRTVATPAPAGSNAAAEKQAGMWKWGVVCDYVWDDVRKVFGAGDWLGAVGLLGTALFVDRAIHENADAAHRAALDAAVAAKQRERAMAIIDTVASAIGTHFGLNRADVAARAGTTPRKAASNTTPSDAAGHQGKRRRKGAPGARPARVASR
jgi:hypothetical protein